MAGRMLETGLAALLLLVAGVAAIHAPLPEGPVLFRTAAVCMGCHNGLTTAAGKDVSIGIDWRASMMANAARDPYWQAGVRREVTDHPSAQAAIEDECSKCHMPMARYEAHAAGGAGRIFAHLPAGGAPGRAGVLAADGVSCTACHQIAAEGLGTRESFVGGFVVDAQRPEGGRRIYGPYDVDAGRTALMRSASRFVPSPSSHIQQSEVCATCHTLYTHALGAVGEAVGELPEQVPYLEWEHSAYARERSCQSCHMPVVADSTAITAVMGRPRANVSRHVFRGGNFFVPRILNRYAGELGVAALPQELDAAATRTTAHLGQRAARVALEDVHLAGGRLVAVVSVENLAGHKLPTAYPSRRAWLHVAVRDRDGDVVFESGAFRPDGSIAGNDNDADGTRYEPHYAEIVREDQVQVYEAVMAGPDGAVTTGLLTAVRFAKDNRVLPRGFDKATADADVAVHGGAAEDADFSGGGDRVRYAVDVAGAEGPFEVEAALWYQPVAYRWAQNLGAYDTFETARFARYYDAMASASAQVLAVAAATLGAPGTR